VTLLAGNSRRFLAAAKCHGRIFLYKKFRKSAARVPQGRYAEHLRSTGQGINNPGGYATTIHRTGEADMLIEIFLHPETTDSSSNLAVAECPDCKGTGFFYPKGIEGGVARCKHERLGKEGE
jgi:hypothetical protein